MKKFNTVQYIILLGTFRSGSGAVIDYLNGRGDLYDPMGKEEYHLPQMPNGLMALEASTEEAFHPASSDFVLTQFEMITSKLSNQGSFWKYGRNYNKRLPSFNKLIKKFIDEITAANYPMRLDWHRLNRSKIEYVIAEIKNYFAIDNKIPNSRILVSKKKIPR